MRLISLTIACAMLAASSSWAQQAPDARAAYVERRGLIEADSACRLFTPSVRDALNVGLAQARGSLLRAGWTNAQLVELDAAARGAAQRRNCADARTQSAADAARRSAAAWVNAGTMTFPGWERAWLARRTPNAMGWRLSQELAPNATFGVRDSAGAQRLALATTQYPQSARVTLSLRDPTHARAGEVTLNQRVAYGLAAGLPAGGRARDYPATHRRQRIGGSAHSVFEFPDAAFRDLLELDPRESIVLQVTNGRASERLLVEVGDVAAARAFLLVRR